MKKNNNSYFINKFTGEVYLASVGGAFVALYSADDPSNDCWVEAASFRRDYYPRGNKSTLPDDFGYDQLENRLMGYAR